MPGLKSDHTANTSSDIASSHEASAFVHRHPELQFVDLLIADINGVVRGKRIDSASLDKVYSKGVAMPASLFALNIQGYTVEETGLGLEIGEADMICYPISETLCMTPWQSRPIAQLLMSMHEDRQTPFFADPRHQVVKMLERFKSLGLTPVTAFELEFYLIDQKQKDGRPQPPCSPMSGKRPDTIQVYSIDDLDEYSDFLIASIEAAHAQGLPADTIVAESAPGQFEINLSHIDDALTACDQAILLKRVIRNVAYEHGMDATFMAKPYEEQAGSGMHVHISLLDEQGRNVLAPQHEGDLPNDTLRWAMGGLLEMMGESFAFLCPNINSYRRFGPGFYVPSAPTWGMDNRTTALRVPTGDDNATRIEHRVAGADANPYLVMTALLAGIYYGITQQIEPGDPIEGNAYDQTEASLPCSLRDALRLLRDSKQLEQDLGSEFIDVFCACKDNELETFEQTISALEYRWYLNTL
ncbi:gamma-glutamylputrescine synthetase [Terasakiispira papahanaumokuakeensis]|uniref:Gamma-glutamylputrescine synthetase n=1 Tax=Terasakiispira papahanaumokuakeensis TaxID=197479 RepID=A0A1E2V9K3_9GAMM|nr:glutamine synthetase family protein [Terasakiispira papahanaumokuakeensis]ODC03654.1 gamma-glutamylputrescine synthetase [Terasakiispira papahanaumokuakeensis]